MNDTITRPTEATHEAATPSATSAEGQNAAPLLEKTDLLRTRLLQMIVQNELARKHPERSNH